MWVPPSKGALRQARRSTMQSMLSMHGLDSSPQSGRRSCRTLLLPFPGRFGKTEDSQSLQEGGGLRQEVLYHFGGTWPTGPSAMAFCVLQRLPLMIGPWASGGIGGIVRGILQHRIQWHGPRSTAKHRPQEGGQWTVDWSVPRGWT